MAIQKTTTSGYKLIWVNGYHKKDGTYVHGYWRKEKIHNSNNSNSSSSSGSSGGSAGSGSSDSSGSSSGAPPVTSAPPITIYLQSLMSYFTQQAGTKLFIYWPQFEVLDDGNEVPSAYIEVASVYATLYVGSISSAPMHDLPTAIGILENDAGYLSGDYSIYPLLKDRAVFVDQQFPPGYWIQKGPASIKQTKNSGTFARCLIMRLPQRPEGIPDLTPIGDTFQLQESSGG